MRVSDVMIKWKVFNSIYSFSLKKFTLNFEEAFIKVFALAYFIY
jgi:hypothetical protein